MWQAKAFVWQHEEEDEEKNLFPDMSEAKAFVLQNEEEDEGRQITS